MAEEKINEISLSGLEAGTIRRSVATNGNGVAARQSPPGGEELKQAAPTTGHHTTLKEESPEVQGAETSVKSGSKRRMLLAVLGLALLLGVIAGIRYALHARQYESTDDAFIEGHATQISPKIS